MSRTKELPSSNVGKYIQLIGLVLACGTLAFSYMKKEGVWLYADTQPLGNFVKEDFVRGGGVGSKEGEKIRDAAGLTEQVQDAIVTVTTSWGQGTGFFLRENALITGRHLIEPDLKKIAALEEQVARNKEALHLEEAKLHTYQARLRKIRKKDSQEALSLLIAEREEYLAAFRAQQERDEQRLVQQKKAKDQPVIRIMHANGVEQQASVVQVSKKYGIALLRASPPQRNSVLEPPLQGTLLQLGATVFIPNDLVPADSKWSTGTFVGYRRIGKANRMYLQIAAKLAQDKSGSPVVDETGAVRAVVTRVGQAGPGAVFALPIEKVLDEFAAALSEEEL